MLQALPIRSFELKENGRLLIQSPLVSATMGNQNIIFHLIDWIFLFPECSIDRDYSRFNIEQEFLKFKLNANGKAADTIRTSATMDSETRIWWYIFEIYKLFFFFLPGNGIGREYSSLKDWKGVFKKNKVIVLKILFFLSWTRFVH